MPFDKEDNSGIVYVWVGSKADPEEARITEEIARDMYDGVSYFYFSSHLRESRTDIPQVC